MLKSPSHLTRLPYSSQSPATLGDHTLMQQSSAPTLPLSPAASGRGLNTQPASLQRVPEGAAALPFAPSPALVASLPQPPRASAALPYRGARK
jgi:hypothetical protein